MLVVKTDCRVGTLTHYMAAAGEAVVEEAEEADVVAEEPNVAEKMLQPLL